MALTFLNVSGKYLRLNICTQLPLIRDFSIRMFNAAVLHCATLIFSINDFFGLRGGYPL